MSTNDIYNLPGATVGEVKYGPREGKPDISPEDFKDTKANLAQIAKANRPRKFSEVTGWLRSKGILYTVKALEVRS